MSVDFPFVIHFTIGIILNHLIFFVFMPICFSIFIFIFIFTFTFTSIFLISFSRWLLFFIIFTFLTTYRYSQKLLHNLLSLKHFMLFISKWRLIQYLRSIFYTQKNIPFLNKIKQEQLLRILVYIPTTIKSFMWHNRCF
jgi:hypothetical protein